MDRLEFEREVVAAARAMATGSSTQHVLDRAAQVCVEVLDNCDLAGICVFGADGASTRAASHADVQLLDELQVELGEGPALNELRVIDLFTVGDLLDDPPWPQWGPRVADDIGVRSFMGFRLYVDAASDSIGVLNIYSFKPHAFEYPDVLDGMVLAGHAAVALDAQIERTQMHTALRSHQMIGEAIGILRERFTLTSEQAFAVLRRISSQQEVKLFSVAQHLVETGTLLHDGDGAP